MTHHHHHPGHAHPSPQPSRSLLRMSAWQRLGVVALVAAVLWALVLTAVWSS